MSTTSKLVNCFHYAYEAKSPILLQCPLQGSLTSCNPMLCLCSPPLPSLILLHTYDLCEFQLLTSLLPQGGFLLLFSTGASDPATPIASSKNNLKPKRVLKNVYPRLENNMMNSIRNTHTHYGINKELFPSALLYFLLNWSSVCIHSTGTTR